MCVILNLDSMSRFFENRHSEHIEVNSHDYMMQRILNEISHKKLPEVYAIAAWWNVVIVIFVDYYCRYFLCRTMYYSFELLRLLIAFYS